ncbi:hypothetical protein ACFFX0_11090 [Citricoccus parietis]|uniref:Uncharacterized protein n=1 Tax=Citricoccus parietis TaxID=592307 RepID=A0ABV5FYI3_9MICC
MTWPRLVRRDQATLCVLIQRCAGSAMCWLSDQPRKSPPMP